MKVTLQSTDRIVELQTASGRVPARIWEGQTERGIAVHAYITRIAVRMDRDASQFEAELIEAPTVPVSPDVSAIPTRLLIP